jgi:hypothetical protein
MSSYRNLKQLKELFGDYVDPEFINYPPSHGWIVEGYNYERELVSTYQRRNLYLMLSNIFDLDNAIPYLQYEECVSAGLCFNNTGNIPIPSGGYFYIKYSGPLGPGTEKNQIQDSTVTAQSLALECILLITEVARQNDEDKLHEIRSYLCGL